MKKLFFVLNLLIISQLAMAQNKDARLYEMRIYYCEPNRLDALVQRFTNHTTKLFEKHGMTNVGYWIPTNNTDNKLIYVLSYPNKEAREASWKAFMSDPDWQTAMKQSEESGKIVAKVESIFMNATDFSPEIKPSSAKETRTFELRVYTQFAGKSEDILARFRNHTTKIFESHNMTNIAYWTSIEKDNAQPKLYYILAFPSEEAGKKSWEDFRKDPEWIKARDESEKNGKIVENAASTFMKPTAFSTIK